MFAKTLSFVRIFKMAPAKINCFVNLPYAYYGRLLSIFWWGAVKRKRKRLRAKTKVRSALFGAAMKGLICSIHTRVPVLYSRTVFACAVALFLCGSPNMQRTQQKSYMKRLCMLFVLDQMKLR